MINIKSVADLSDLEKMSLMDLSYSRIDTYKMCPAKYFYGYIQREPRLFGEAAVLGNIVHSVLEDNLSNEKDLDIESLFNSYEQKKSEWDPNSIINSELISVGKEILNEFYDRHSGETLHIKHKEMGFNFIVGPFNVNGFIDRVDEYDDRIDIIDYKTGKWEVSQKSIKDNLQLGIYALAAKLAYPDKQIYAELYYLRSGKRKGHLFTDEDIQSAYDNLIEQGNKIRNDISFPTTSNERVCSFCDHAKSGACATGVMRNKKAQSRKALG